MHEQKCEVCKYENSVRKSLSSIKLNSKEFLSELQKVFCELREKHKPDDCSDCLFFIKYLLRCSRLEIAQLVQIKRKNEVREKICKAAKGRSSKIFSINETNPNITYYLDHNIFDKCRRDSQIKEKLINCSNINFIHSIVHIDEIMKCKSESMREQYFDIVHAITKDSVIFIKTHDPAEFKVGKYKQQEFIDQVNDFKELTELEEEMRLVDFADRFVFFNHFKNGAELKKLDDNELGQLFVLYGCNPSFKKPISSIINYIDLRVAFYAFFMILDAIRYRSDKEVHTVISGTHDWEHLLYASNANYFITEDKRLKARAEVIFNKFKCKTKVISLNSFFDSNKRKS